MGHEGEDARSTAGAAHVDSSLEESAPVRSVLIGGDRQQRRDAQEVAAVAEDLGLEYGLEVVNRYETNLINTASRVPPPPPLPLPPPPPPHRHSYQV